MKASASAEMTTNATVDGGSSRAGPCRNLRHAIDSLRCRLVPLAVFAFGYAVVWNELALLAGALIAWSRHV